jgi:molybdopterin-guanine dinucleotide biosynthesis adapter protein
MTRPANPKYCFPAAPVRAGYRIADRNKMKVIGLAGWSGAGKTTLLSRAIPYLRQQGLRVSVIKHAHHGFDVDVPGKDSWVHRQSGAEEVLVTSANRWALMHELRGDREPRLTDLLRKMSPVDLVIVEGFKSEPYPKIEIHRRAAGKALLFLDDPAIVAIATDAAIETTLPLAHLDDIPSIAELMRTHAISLEDMLAASAANA